MDQWSVWVTQQFQIKKNIQNNDSYDLQKALKKTDTDHMGYKKNLKERPYGSVIRMFYEKNKKKNHTDHWTVWQTFLKKLLLSKFDNLLGTKNKCQEQKKIVVSLVTHHKTKIY